MNCSTLNTPIVIEWFFKSILESKNPKYNYLFARDVEGANILKHGAVIKQSGNKEYIEKYESELSVSNFVEDVKQHIINYKKKD